MKISDLAWIMIDSLFPMQRGLSESEIQKQKDLKDSRITAWKEHAGQLKDDLALHEHIAEFAKLLEREESRRHSVEARLTSIIGLCSIAATIVFGSILAQATGTLQVSTYNWLRWIMGLGSLYLALQLCIAVMAAVRGLERKYYISEALWPMPLDLSATDVLRDKITSLNQKLIDHEGQNNDKVTQMAIAHRSLKNFLVVLLLLAIGGACASITLNNSKNRLIDELRTNRELQDLLRGPQGAQGPQGAPCVQPQTPKGVRGRKP